MKFLFSGSDLTRMELIWKKVKGAGIRCELRSKPDVDDQCGVAWYPELWIQNEDEFDQAAGLLARCLQGR